MTKEELIERWRRRLESYSSEKDFDHRCFETELERCIGELASSYFDGRRETCRRCGERVELEKVGRFDREDLSVVHLITPMSCPSCGCVGPLSQFTS